MVVFIIIIDNIESFKVLYKIKLKPKIKEGIKRTNKPVVIKTLITATTIKKNKLQQWQHNNKLMMVQLP